MLSSVANAEEAEVVARIGHNNPPGEIDEALERLAKLQEAADVWAKATISSAKAASRAADFDAQLLREYQKRDKQRDDEKRPHDEAAKAVQHRWKPILDGIAACRAVISGKLRTWKLAEQSRLDAERAEAALAAAEERHKAEAARAVSEKPEATATEIAAAVVATETAAAATKQLTLMPERAQVRGEVSTRATGLRKRYVATVTDIDTCFAHYRANAKIHDLLTQLANAETRAGGRTIPGCRIDEEFI